MGAATGQQVVCDTPAAGVLVARFIRPDVREQLYDKESIAECALFRELHAAAVADLAPGQSLILNVGLIDRFPTAFYRFLLEVNREVASRKARLLLCCMTPNVKEAFELMGGGKVFTGQVRVNEDRAIYDATHQPG